MGIIVPQCTNRNRNWNLHIPKIRFVFLVSCMLLNFNSVWNIVPIRWKICWPEPKKRKSHPHTSQIGYLLPVYGFRNIRPRIHHISNSCTNRNRIRICTSLKSDFYFRFHSPLNTESALLNFIYTWDYWCWSIEKCAHQSMKTAEMGIRTPLKSANCIRFLSQIGVHAPTFLSRLQNFVKIGKVFWIVNSG